MDDRIQSNRDRTTAIAGFTGVALVVAGIICESFGSPDPSQSAAEVTRKFADSATLVYIGGDLLLAATLAILVFSVGVSRLMRRGGYPFEADFVIVVAGIGTALDLIYIASWEGIAAAISQLHTDPAVVFSLFRLSTAVDAISGIPSAIVIGVAAWFLWRCGILGSKMHWFGIISGVILGLGALSPAMSGLLGLLYVLGSLLSFVWILIASTVLLRRRAKHSNAIDTDSQAPIADVPGAVGVTSRKADRMSPER